MELKTIEGVELVSTGTYQLASGETTFTAEDMAAAVAAAGDPTVTTPRLKLGHNDPRFDDAIASGELGGEPAFGTVENLRLSEDGQTVIGDYTNVPDWLADSMPSSYPGRSIEGGFGFQAASGRTYDFVISDVALLGVTWPGVGSLEDLKTVLQANGAIEPTPVAAASGRYEFDRGSSERFVVARIERPGEKAPSPGVVGGLDMGMIPRRFCDDLDQGAIATDELDGVGPTLWWWPRSVRAEDDGSMVLIVDDDEGHLISVPFTVAGTDLSYGNPEVVMETFVPVAASSGVERVPRVLAAWPNTIRAERPSTIQEAVTMDVDIAVLRTQLGLDADADEATITAKLAETKEPEAKPARTQAAAIPEGTVLIDQAKLAELEAGATAGTTVAAKLAETERDATIIAAIKQGRIAAGAREQWVDRWTKTPDEARTLLTAKVEDGGLAAVIPVGGREIGAAGDGETNTRDADVMDSFVAQRFPQAAARLRGDHNGRSRVSQEA